MSQARINIIDPILAARVERVQKGRGDNNITKTARTLLHERLLELEEKGDPAAMHQRQPSTESTSNTDR